MIKYNENDIALCGTCNEPLRDQDTPFVNDDVTEIMCPRCMAEEGRPLTHMTRVVGYFSRVENWNPSKVGELHDRQKGTYDANHAAKNM